MEDYSTNNPLLARLQVLEQETDFEFVVELIDIYLSETPKQIQLIASAINAQDHSALTITAHTLKGSSLNLGVQSIGALCLKLEELGRSGSKIPPETNTGEIEKEFEVIKSQLNTYKQTKK